jgi:type III secretion protein U
MSDEKTEKPTPKKLQDARKKGEVVKSKEIVSTLEFIALLGVLWLGGKYFTEKISNVLDIALEQIPRRPDQQLPLTALIERFISETLWIIIPFVVVALVAGVAGGFAQVRALFSVEPIMFKVERMNPATNLKNLFSTRQVYELVKMVLKTGLLVGVLYMLTKDFFAPALKTIYLSHADISNVAAKMLLILFGWAAVVYVVMAAVDYGHQFYEFMKQQKMSVDEIRREYKDMEGDPYIKGRRKQLAYEMLEEPMLQKASRASVVVTNPTHYAVALYYKPGQTDLPVVVAKGQDATALRIREAARKAGVPIMENKLLARQLYAQVPLNEYIGEDFVEAVAEVFKWIKRLHQDKKT